MFSSSWGVCWTLLGINSQGAFGEICVAKWRGTTVAAKTILAPLANNPQIVWVSSAADDFGFFHEDCTKLKSSNIMACLQNLYHTHRRSLPFLLCHQWLPEYYLLKIVKQSLSSLCDGEQEGVHWWTGNAGTTLSSKCSAIPWCSHKNPPPSHGYRISSQSKNSLSLFCWRVMWHMMVRGILTCHVKSQTAGDRSLIFYCKCQHVRVCVVCLTTKDTHILGHSWSWKWPNAILVQTAW